MGYASLRRDEDMRVAANQGCFSGPDLGGTMGREFILVSTGAAGDSGRKTAGLAEAAGPPDLPTLFR